MREAQVPGTLQVSVSSISNLNKEGVRFLIISLSDLEFIPSTYLNPLW